MMAGQTWVLVWDPLEFFVEPAGESIPLLAWCELSLKVRDPQVLQKQWNKSEVSPEDVKSRVEPSVRAVLSRKYSQQDWRQVTLVRGYVEEQVKKDLTDRVPQGTEVEKFLIRAICTFEEYLQLLQLRGQFALAIRSSQDLPEQSAANLLHQLSPLVELLSSEERKEKPSQQLKSLRRVVSVSRIILAGRYRLECPIGKGGMGIVYKSYDQMGQRWVAIKFLPEELQKSPKALEDFRKNFQTICPLQHQHICPLYTIEKDKLVGDFLVMKYVEGVSACEYRQAYLQRHPNCSFPGEKLLAILQPVAEALDYAHGQRVVHRDIKPSNILVVVEKHDPEKIMDVQVIDFGLAARIRSSTSQISVPEENQWAGGTPSYMAPEQWQGDPLTARTDQYALAVVAYELISGRLPFPQENLVLLRHAVVSLPPPEIHQNECEPGVDLKALNEVLKKGLAKEPADRYETCREFVQALAAALGRAQPPLPLPPEKEKVPPAPKPPLPPGLPKYQTRCFAGDWLDWVWEARIGGPEKWEATGLPLGWQCRAWGALAGIAPLDSKQVVISAQSDPQAAPISLSVEIKSLEEFLMELGFQPIEPGVLQEPPKVGTSQFCYVPGGYFLLGYHPNPQRIEWLRTLRIDEDVARQRWPGGLGHCNSFLISRFKVTNQEYAEFVRAVGGHRPPHWSDNQPPEATERHPVTNISYQDAQAYCQWKSQKAQEAGLPIVYRLPTHWEWEKAARGACTSAESALTEAAQPDGPGRIYPWGDQFQDTFLNSLTGRGPAQIQDVDVLMGLPTPWKVCELVGNAYEWVEGGTVQSGVVYKYLRGVPWNERGEYLGLAFLRAVYAESDVRQKNIGFRCVIQPARAQAPPQAFVPLGNCQFVDGAGRQQTVNYRFAIARFAVTNEEFQKFRPEHNFPSWQRWHPVVNVSWQEAQQFCQWKTQQEGRFYRLPLRHEWELACRGVEGRKYPWGNEYVPYWCNSLESGWGEPIDVDSLPQGASPEGVYHLCGNVFEWLQNGEAVGGAYNATCETFGAPPYKDIAQGNKEGKPYIGFRYITLLLS